MRDLVLRICNYDLKCGVLHNDSSLGHWTSSPFFIPRLHQLTLRPARLDDMLRILIKFFMLAEDEFMRWLYERKILGLTSFSLLALVEHQPRNCLRGAHSRRRGP